MKIEQLGRFAKFKFEPEKYRRLFFVTDIHGQYELFQEALNTIGFVSFGSEKSKPDYIVSLGDMCDRGQKSLDVLSFFRHHPHATSICGNHERLMYVATRRTPAETVQGEYVDWVSQGGDWHFKHPFAAIQEVAEWANTLPYAAEVHIDDRVIGLTHAEVIPNESVTAYGIDSRVDNKFADTKVSWANTVDVTSKIPLTTPRPNQFAAEYLVTFNRDPVETKIELSVLGLDAALHGHSIHKGAPVVLGNQVYFDNGAVAAALGSEGNHLTILEYIPQSEATKYRDLILGMFRPWQFQIDAYGQFKVE